MGMDLQQLVVAGLHEQQAKAYALLLELGEIKPSVAATKLKTTRTNTYKVLDKLVEMGLANKQKTGSTFVYTPNNPLALTKLSADLRAEAAARENAVNAAMNSLLQKFYEHAKQPSVEVLSGREAVANAYRKQIILGEELYFVHTYADVPTMGFDTMHELRTRPAYLGMKRHGIMSAPKDGGTINHESHKRSNLDVTWAEEGGYDAPVEWSVTKSSLLIILFGNEPHAILITNPLVAGAFMQIWQLLSSLLRQQPTHKKIAR